MEWSVGLAGKLLKHLFGSLLYFGAQFLGKTRKEFFPGGLKNNFIAEQVAETWKSATIFIITYH